MKKSIYSVGIALFAANLGHAAPYQVELGAGYSSVDYDNDFLNVDYDEDVWNFGGTYYIDLVDDGKGPLAEAAFLDRASGISLAYADGEIDFDRLGIFDEEAYDIDLGEFDEKAYGVGGRFVDKNTGWTFSGAYVYSEEDFFDSETDVWELGLGKYIAENTELFFNYVNISVDADEVTIPSIGTFEPNDLDIFSVGVKHVAPMSGQMYYAIDASLDYVDEDGGDEGLVWNGAFTWYPARNFGIGAGIAYEDFDDYESEVYSVFGNWYITDQVAVSLSYQMDDNDDLDFDADTIAAGVTFRF